MKVCITGVAGFVGSHLADYLIKAGHEVTGIDDLSRGDAHNLAELSDLSFEKVDIISNQNLAERFRDVEVVYHLAAVNGTRLFYEQAARVIEVNVTGTQRVLEAAVKADVSHLVFTSTSEVYGANPPIPTSETAAVVFPSPEETLRFSYGASKYLNEIQCHASPLDCSIVRLFNAYGPRLEGADHGQVVGIFLRQLLAGKRPTLHQGSQTRSFCFVEDSVAGIVAAASKPGTYNIGAGAETTIGELLEKLQQVVGTKLEPILEDRPLGDAIRRCPDVTKAERELGWTPKISLEEGLARTVQWYREN